MGGGGRSVDPEPLLEGHLGFPDGTPETHRPGEGSPSTQQGLWALSLIRMSATQGIRSLRVSLGAPSGMPSASQWLLVLLLTALPRNQGRKVTVHRRSTGRKPPQVMPTLSFSRVRSPGNHILEGHELIFLNWIMFDSSDFNVYTLGFLIIEKNSVKITCMSYWKPFITEMWTICAERCIILRMLRVSPRELRSLLPLEEGRLRDPFFLVGPVSRKCQSWIQRSVIVTSLAPVVLFLALSCSIRYLIFYFNFNNFIMCIHVCDFTCP